VNGMPPFLAIVAVLLRRFQQALRNFHVLVVDVHEELFGGGRGGGGGAGVGFLRVAPHVVAGQPVLVAVGLQPPDEAVHGDVDRVRTTVAARGALAVLHPPLGGEVGRLCHVEAGVEAAVVAKRKGDHDLALLLRYLVVGNGVLPEEVWRDETHFVSKVGRTVLDEVGEESSGHALEPPGVSGRDGVPELGLAVVQVVDGVEVHVLGVPGKGRLPHAEVQVGRVDAANLHLVILVDPVQDRAQLLDVPNITVVVGD